MKKLVLFAVVVAGVALSSCKKEAAPIVDEEQKIEETVVNDSTVIITDSTTIVVDSIK